MTIVQVGGLVLCSGAVSALVGDVGRQPRIELVGHVLIGLGGLLAGLSLLHPGA